MKARFTREKPKSFEWLEQLHNYKFILTPMRYPLALLIPIGIVSASLAFSEQKNEPLPEEKTPLGMHLTHLEGEAKGEKIYAQWCADCHGANGRDFIQRSWKLGSQEADIKRIISSGYSLLGMPAYGDVLDPKDIENVAQFLLKKASESPEFRTAPPQMIDAFDLQIRANVIAEDLATPWGMDFLNDSTLLFTEREGNLWVLQSGTKQAILGLPEDFHVKGQGGLLDVMVWNEPDIETPWVYLSYSKKHPTDNKRSATAVVRGALTNTEEGYSVATWETLMVATPYAKTHRHYGSRLAMGTDQMLYVTCGERGMRDVHPQTLRTYPGKVHRLRPDGSIPEDNPFVGVSGAIPSIWSWGHRNPQGMFIHPETGAVWTHEHGPKGGDEINILKKAANYGWPEITFGRNYSGTIITRDTSKTGMEQPLHYWLPSIGACGMDLVRGDAWPASWQNNLLVGSLSFEYLERLIIDDSGRVRRREKLLGNIGRVRDIARNSKGEIYVAIEGAGVILHLDPILKD
jgi:glucose/arabinose dehydrogenase